MKAEKLSLILTTALVTSAVATMKKIVVIDKEISSLKKHSAPGIIKASFDQVADEIDELNDRVDRAFSNQRKHGDAIKMLSEKLSELIEDEESLEDSESEESDDDEEEEVFDVDGLDVKPES